MEAIPSPSQVPVFILAGGLGVRLSEETHSKPKPMIEIGGIPILVHLLRWYYSHGFNDFVICAGYRSWEIKSYFLNYEFRRNHLVIDHRATRGRPPAPLGYHHDQEKWRIRVVDTGEYCMTGARVARAVDFISKLDSFEHFAVTYGDGLSDVDLLAELRFHVSHGRIGTVLGVPPLARFGELDVGDDGVVRHFNEKPQSRQGLINGGFQYFRKDFRKYLDDAPDCVLEKSPLMKLSEDQQLIMYPHRGFWHPMDTLRDKNYLEDLWKRGKAPWLSKRKA